MSTEPTVARPPHKWVADQIGFSIAGVSLLRGGLRKPSMRAMEKIEKAFGWPMSDQVEHRNDYANAFERVVEERYARSLEQA